MDQGMQVLSYLISGVLLYGGIGWLADHFLGTGFLLPLGIVLGAGFGIYLVVKRFAADISSAPAGSGAAAPASGARTARSSSRTEEETT